jgi:hypothetical protein
LTEGPTCTDSLKHDNTFARYRKQAPSSPAKGFKSPKKEILSNQIKEYQQGNISLNEFKRQLKKNDIELNGALSRVFRRSEAGESVPFVCFGKEIFKQIEKIEGVSSRFGRNTSPERADQKDLISAAKKVMQVSQSQYLELSQNSNAVTAEMDKLRFEQLRHIGKTYVPRKGKSREKFVDAQRSSLGPIFNMSETMPSTPSPTKVMKQDWQSQIAAANKTVHPLLGNSDKEKKRPSA